MSVAEVAASGDRRATLEAMRDKLAADFDAAPPAVVAQIAGRLSAVLLELEEIGSSRTVSAVDELNAKRAARLSEAGVPESPRRASRQRG